MEEKNENSALWVKVNRFGLVIGIVVAVVSTIATVAMLIQVQVLHDENTDLNARISGYTTSVASGDLVLTGGGADFLKPERIEVIPLWAAASGLPITELRGLGFLWAAGYKTLKLRQLLILTSLVVYAHILKTKSAAMSQNLKGCS